MSPNTYEYTKAQISEQNYILTYVCAFSHHKRSLLVDFVLYEQVDSEREREREREMSISNPFRYWHVVLLAIASARRSIIYLLPLCVYLFMTRSHPVPTKSKNCDRERNIYSNQNRYGDGRLVRMYVCACVCICQCNAWLA